MMVMVSNQTGTKVGYLAGRYSGLVGHLFSPSGERGPWPFLPYALDNGAWPAHKNNRPWDEGAWRALLRWAAGKRQRPVWALVPDCVGDRTATLDRWHQYLSEVVELGFEPAFAAQDGMTFDDVPPEARMVFLGGSTEWKLEAIEPWCARFPERVHVARVNTWDRLLRCYRAGAVSVDGTGWFHDLQYEDLVRYLRLATETPRQRYARWDATVSRFVTAFRLPF